MKIVAFEPKHLDVMDLQGAQDYVSSWVTPAIKAELAQGMSFSAIDGDEVLACAGVLEFWPGRATAWAILSGRCGSRFRPIHRAVSRFLDLQSGRIEATADIGFGPGHRWLQMLGFKVETECMKAYMPNGADAAMYVRGV